MQWSPTVWMSCPFGPEEAAAIERRESLLCNIRRDRMHFRTALALRKYLQTLIGIRLHLAFQH